jgi:hypothetical protein
MWVSGGLALPFLTSALDGGEWLASRPCRYTPEDTASVPTGEDATFYGEGGISQSCNIHGDDEKSKYILKLKNLKARFHFGDLGVYGKVILKCISQKQDVRVWNGFNGSR